MVRTDDLGQPSVEIDELHKGEGGVTLALLKAGPDGQPSEADVDLFLEELGFPRKKESEKTESG